MWICVTSHDRGIVVPEDLCNAVNVQVSRIKIFGFSFTAIFTFSNSTNHLIEDRIVRFFLAQQMSTLLAILETINVPCAYRKIRYNIPV